MQRSGSGPFGPRGGGTSAPRFRSYPQPQHRDLYARVTRAMNELAQAWAARSLPRIRDALGELNRAVVDFDGSLERDSFVRIPEPKGGAA